MVTLGRERLTLGSQAVSMFRLHERMVEAARDRDLLDPVLSRSMTRLWARMWLLRFTWQRAIDSGDLSVARLLGAQADDLGNRPATWAIWPPRCSVPTRAPTPRMTSWCITCWWAGRRRSWAAPARFSATSSASGCWACPKNRVDDGLTGSRRRCVRCCGAGARSPSATVSVRSALCRTATRSGRCCPALAPAGRRHPAGAGLATRTARGHRARCVHRGGRP